MSVGLRTIAGMCVAAVFICGAGCQTISVGKKKPVTAQTPKKVDFNPLSSFTGKKYPTGKPDSIIAMWKDATYTVANESPTRGFGGRLYFYDRNKQPIIVDGDLIVYGFCDSNAVSTSAGDHSDGKPEKRFVFPREELKHHMSISSAGPSYSVWLPWDHINGVQKNVSIVAVFRGADGKICESEMIPAILPGYKPELEEEKHELIEEIRRLEANRNNVQKAGFESTMPKGTRKVKSHEIRLPGNASERLFGHVPRKEYVLPKPNVGTFSDPGDVTRSARQPSVDSAPDPRPAQSGQFE